MLMMVPLRLIAGTIPVTTADFKRVKSAGITCSAFAQLRIYAFLLMINVQWQNLHLTPFVPLSKLEVNLAHGGFVWRGGSVL